jgi:formate dehydrogenase (NADP+) alpha subunit
LETVTISLNGREVAGPPGTTILDLARQVGIETPTLCHHPLLKSAGACRVCLVEDVKTGRVIASCVTPITKGMEILTDSQAAVTARRGVLELLLSDHPSSCVICSKGNQCVLRSLAKDHGVCDPELDPIRRWMPVQEVNPFIVRDLTKCVLCGRCIRVCKEFEAVGAIEYMDRGYNSHPGTTDRSPLEGSECNFCGSCVAICPTDALAGKDKFSISSGTVYAAGICSYCGTGCGLEYQLADGVVAGARGILESPVNSLSLCVRGHYGLDALSSSARLTDPLVRQQDGTLAQAKWDEALDEVSNRLRLIIGRHGPSSIGVIAGTQCSNEELYLAGRFARSNIGTPHIDSTARFSSGPIVAGLTDSLGSIHPGVSLRHILEAQTIVLVAARPDYSHPVVARNIRQAVRNKGTALVQFDPLVTSLSPFSRVHLRYDVEDMPQSLMQLMRVLVADSRYDLDFLRNTVINFPEWVSGLNLPSETWTTREKINEAAELIRPGRKVVFLIGPAANKTTHGYLLVRQLVNLAFLCGQHQSVFFLFEGCNELGAWEMGCSPDRLPGNVPLSDLDAQETVRRTWETDIVSQRGLNCMDMIRAAESRDMRAILFLGVDPLTVFPDTARTKKALAGMDLVVRSGLFPAQIDELAGFVFPGTAITEADGTYTSIEGRVQRVSKITDPPGNARPNARFINDLAGRIGHPMGFLTARDIFEEIRTVCTSWQALTWADVGTLGGARLPNDEDRWVAEGVRLYESLLAPCARPDSSATSHEASAERPWKVFPEERAVHPGDGVVSARSYRLARFLKEDSVRMTPEDAERINARDGGLMSVRSEAGEATARLVIDPAVPPSGIVIPSGGPRYILQRLVPWPEQADSSGVGPIFVSVTPMEG